MVVESFRSRRPISRNGDQEWSRNSGDLQLAKYVINEVDHHITQSVCSVADRIDINEWLADPMCSAWFRDVPQDAIAVGCARVLGIPTMEKLAAQAEREEQWWDAALRWSLAGNVALTESGRPVAIKLWRKAVSCMVKANSSGVHIESSVHGNARTSARTRPGQLGDKSAETFKRQFEQLELNLLCRILASYEVQDPINFKDRIEVCAKTRAAQADPLSTFQLFMGSKFVPAYQKCDDFDINECSRAFTELAMCMITSSMGECQDDRDLCLALAMASIAFGTQWFIHAVEEPTDWEDWLGKGGDYVVESSRAAVGYMYEQMHVEILELCGWNPSVMGGNGWALAVRWGDMVAADELWANSYELLRRILADPDRPNQAYSIFCAICSVPIGSYLVGRKKAAAKMMREAKHTWKDAEEMVIGIAVHANPIASIVPVEQVAELNEGCFQTAIMHVWYMRLCHALVDDDVKLSPEELATIPTPAELRELSNMYMTGDQTFDKAWVFANPLVPAAMLLEKYELYDRALVHAEECCVESPRIDFETNLRGLLVKGRILSRSRKTADATSCFHKARELAERLGMRMYELLALRDLHLWILAPAGAGGGDVSQAAEAETAMGKVLLELKGDDEDMNDILGHGYDAKSLRAKAK